MSFLRKIYKSISFSNMLQLLQIILPSLFIGALTLMISIPMSNYVSFALPSDAREYFLLLSFLCYVSILCIISIAAARHYKKITSLSSQESSFIGSRSINYWVTAFSAQASDMSDWLFLAFPAQVFLYGSQSYIIALALLLGMWATWHFVAIPLREKSEKYDAITIIDFFERHFDTATTPLRLLATSIIIFFFTIYLAAGIKGIGLISESTFNIPYNYGTALGALIVLMIALTGGFVAAAWTDCFQALFLLGVIVFVPSFLFFKSPTITNIIPYALGRNLSLSPFDQLSWQSLINNLAWGLGYFGMPHILTKFLGIKKAADLRKAKYIGLTWQALALSGATAVGLITIGYSLPGSMQPEKMFISMVLENFHPFFAGLMLCGVLAATISTILAQLLVTATTFTHDLYHRIWFTQATSFHIQKIYRLSMIFFIFFAYCVAYPKEISIFSLVQYAWSGLGSSFGPLMLMSLSNRRISKYSALALLVGGALGSGYWRFFNGDIAWLGYSITEMIPGYVAAFGCMFIVQYFSPRSSQT